MVQRIPDDKCIQLGENIARLHVLDVASMEFNGDKQIVTFHPKITYPDLEFKKIVDDVTATNKSEQYYIDHLGWGYGPDDLTEDQLKLEYALLLAIWEQVDLTMTYGDHGWEYVIGDNPKYCPIYAPAQKLWDALYAPKTKCDDNGQIHMEETNDKIYVRKDGRKDVFDSWADALNAVIEKYGEGDEHNGEAMDGKIETVGQLHCKAIEYDWPMVGIWTIEGRHPMLVFTPAQTIETTDNDLELANKTLKNGWIDGVFSDPRLGSVFLHVPLMDIAHSDNGLLKRVMAGMFIALANNARMYIRHRHGQWKISFDTDTPEAYVNLYNIAKPC